MDVPADFGDEWCGGGARKECYGKYCTATTITPVMLHIIANGFANNIPSSVVDNTRTITFPMITPVIRDRTV
ncbi:hypothetical protein TUM17559_57150 [Enterobacter cloacae]|nr:hypothetical protein TUM17559_57150 [Enterobacter cloacae]GJL15986.1 hypothetical protein TUM17572_57930 [Klebsiella oxytoca]